MLLSYLRKHSIDRTLPVLSSGLVVATVLALSTAAYLRLEHALFANTRTRLEGSARIVASMIGAPPSKFQKELLRTGGDPSLRGFLRGTESRASALAFLSSKTVGHDSTLRSVALLDSNGSVRLVLNVRGAGEFGSWLPPAIRAGELKKRKFNPGPFEELGNRLTTTTTVPIRSDSSAQSGIVGYLAETQNIASTGHRQIEQLVGSHVTLLLGQPGAGVWTDLESIHASPFASDQSIPVDGVYHPAWSGPMLAGTSPVVGTDWLVWVGENEAEVGAPARAFLWETLPVGVTIMLLGTAFMWAYSRRITRPIVALTTSVEKIARLDGEGDNEDDHVRGDELRRLSDAFSRLSDRLDRKDALQEQLVQAQKMEVIGRLAAGIVHDFNNLLTVIQTYTELIIEETPEFDHRHADLKEIQNAARRATVLTKQLLGFSRKSMPQSAIVDTGAVLLSMDAMLKTLVGNGAELHLLVQENLWQVNIDLSQLEQVIANLAVNSRDAMPDHGTLHIEATNLTLAQPMSARFSTILPAEYVALRIRDNGSGMNEETQLRVFEPFFTTKPVGKGTGLGLSTVCRIVDEAGGHILVESEPGEGTEITVLLPRAMVEHSSMDAVLSQLPQTASILLVVSAPMREMWGRVLTRAGYRVLEAASPEDALRLAAECREDVRVIVTDVVLPDRSGPDLVERLTRICPGVRALYVAGLTEDDELRESLSQSGAVVLQKPFTGEDLARGVHSLVG